MQAQGGADYPSNSTPALTEAEASVAAHAGRFYAAAVAGVFVLLTAAAVLVYWKPLSALVARPLAAGAAGADASAITYISDLDFWQRTPRESTVTAAAYFDLQHDLEDVPLQFGAWSGVDKPETNQEVMILLQPEQYVQRLYQNTDGEYMWLSMVGGRSSQPFHAPDICYDADGWQYNLGSHSVALDGGGSVYGLYLDARKDVPEEKTTYEHVVTYFYLFPNSSRSLADGIVLFKLTSGRVGTIEETLKLHEDFVRGLFKSATTADS